MGLGLYVFKERLKLLAHCIPCVPLENKFPSGNAQLVTTIWVGQERHDFGGKFF